MLQSLRCPTDQCRLSRWTSEVDYVKSFIVAEPSQPNSSRSGFTWSQRFRTGAIGQRAQPPVAEAAIAGAAAWPCIRNITFSRCSFPIRIRSLKATILGYKLGTSWHQFINYCSRLNKLKQKQMLTLLECLLESHDPQSTAKSDGQVSWNHCSCQPAKSFRMSLLVLRWRERFWWCTTVWEFQVVFQWFSNFSLQPSRLTGSDMPGARWGCPSLSWSIGADEGAVCCVKVQGSLKWTASGATWFYPRGRERETLCKCTRLASAVGSEDVRIQEAQLGSWCEANRFLAGGHVCSHGLPSWLSVECWGA